ncbi:MAG: pirin family protein [Spirochaetales bacterium]|nr:pirin family protein [Spirochaetales bacterium]
MDSKYVSRIRQLGFQWETKNPFLFCVHHLDHYPKGNEEMGPAASLDGRDLGQDFTLKDGWRMYHGTKIPGFPVHPHRGFETVTVVLNGYVDHSDSMGAAGRYGNGDVQWMTAGGGMQHAEMFPLLKTDGENPLELFQIWLNFPAEKKFVEPSYKMLWSEDIPKLSLNDEAGRATEVTIVAGALEGTAGVPPTPDSWAASAENQVAIWLVKMEAGATWQIPAAAKQATRSLYYYRGERIEVDGQEIGSYRSAALDPSQRIEIRNGDGESRILLLQGRPIEEPVVQYGPFVMNTEAQIRQAFSDYRETGFGGWPWPRSDPVHERKRGRFARYPDGREETR